MTEKKYRIGYIPGTFDLFHIGHLNLIRKAKERCEYLIVGVTTDELSEGLKGKRPFIPLKERMEIVGAIRYVDQAVSVDFETTDKIKAWEQWRYDCHFAGSDHKDHFQREREALSRQGVSMEILPYTESTSSTQIQKLIVQEILMKDSDGKDICE